MNKGTITVGSPPHAYNIGRLDALQQFHVARRLAPVLAVMGVTAAQLSRGLAGTALDDFLPMLGPITEMMSKMPTEDANFIIFECLGVVQRQVGDRGAPVTAGGRLMFEDVDMVVMLRLVAAVVEENLGGFTKGLGAEAPSPTS